MNVRPVEAWECKEPVEAVKDGDIRNIPQVNDATTKGFMEVNEFFVDMSGFGTEDEPAMTISNFLKEVKKGMFYGIKEAGQFQAYVGEYKRNEQSKENS